MEQKKYQVVFDGELKEGHDQEMVVRALAGAYHKEDDFFESWFKDEPIIVKKEATHEEALYIRDYLGDLGLIIEIEPINPVLAAEKKTEELLEDAFAQIQESIKSVQGETVIQKDAVIIQIQPATMRKRFAAYLIDLIICMLAANLILELILAPLGIINTTLIHELSLSVNAANTQSEVRDIVDSYMSNDAFASLIMQVMFFIFMIQVAYFGLMDSKYNASLGKRLFKIKVYSLVSPQVLFRQAALRQVFIIIAFFILAMLLNVIGLLVLAGIFIMGAYDKRGLNQTIFDRITSTFVGVDESKK